MIILGLVGEMGAGKSTVGSYLVTKYGAQRFGFSVILRDLVERLHLPASRDNLIQISIVLRQEFGNDLLAKAMLEDIKQSTAELIVVESIRREDDIVYLRQLPGFHLVGISAAMNERYQRLSGRAEKSDDAHKTYEQFKSDHQRETEATVPPLLATAEHQLHNDGGLDDLYVQVDHLLQEIETKNI